MQKFFFFLVFFFSLGVTGSAWAQSCSLTRTGSLDFGSAVANFPRDASSGTEISRRSISYRMSCRGLPVGYTIGVKFRPNEARCPKGGSPNFLSSDSIRNVGFSFAATPVPPGGTGSSAICTSSSTSVNGRFFDLVLEKVTSATQTFNFSITAAMVKTGGTLQTGAASFSGNIGTLDWTLLAYPPYVNRTFDNDASVNASASLMVRAQTCSVADVTVPMGSILASQLTGVGPKAGPWRNFSIQVNNCPANFKRVRFRLDSVNHLLDVAENVMGLGFDPDIAKGVGIQLVRDDMAGSELGFARLHMAEGYAAIQSTGGSFAIPLKARYYKPAWVSTVMPGRANGAVLFTMSYE